MVAGHTAEAMVSKNKDKAGKRRFIFKRQLHCQGLGGKAKSAKGKKRDPAVEEKAEDAVDFYDQDELMDYTPEAPERWGTCSPLCFCYSPVNIAHSAAMGR